MQQKVAKAPNPDKKEPPIKFVPAKAQAIAPIFSSPLSKEKAEARLAELTAELEAFSDDDSDSGDSSDEKILNGECENVSLKEAEAEVEEESEDDEDSEDAKVDSDASEDDDDESEQCSDDENESPADIDPSSEDEGSADEASDEGGEEEESEKDGEDEEGEKDENGKKDEVETEKQPAATEHQIVGHWVRWPLQVAVMRNSTMATKLGMVGGNVRVRSTNKREWDAFMRQTQNRSKFPIALSEYLQTNKTDLFNFWMDSGKNWNEVQLKVNRSVEAKNTASKGWEAVQGKTLRERYTEEKFDRLVAARKAAGLFYEDEDFPGDEDDPYLNIFDLMP
eukprot:s1366_g23.t1